MKARFAQVCAAITVAVFAAVTVFFVLRLNEAHERSVLNRQAHFDAMSELVAKAYQAAGYSFEHIDWERLADEFDLTRTTGAVSIASVEGQLQYLTAQDVSYLSPTTRAQLEENQEARIGRSEHYLLTSSPGEIRLSETLSSSRGEFIHVEAVYPSLSNADIYPLLRDSFLILLGFAALTLAAALGLYLHRTSHEAAPEYADGFQATPVGDVTDGSDGTDGSRVDFKGNLYSDKDPELDVEVNDGLDAPDSQEDINTPDREKAKLLRRINLELERSTFNEEDLVLALVRSVPLEQTPDPTHATDYSIDETHMRDRLYSFIGQEHAFKELTFTLGNNIIAVIEPNNDLDGGMRRMENLLRKAEERAIAEGGKLHSGLSARTGRLTEAPRLFKEAYTALRRAEYTKSRIMAFRPDPDLYRRFIAGEEASIESS
ncbi:MAG: hypothetical protein EA428_08430 [Spirochaetaceae bacterium]|nr:MAG: hypothetical protein EA428_08430 [Spirochaetaceae bacterium]